MDATSFTGSSGTFLSAKAVAEGNLEGQELTIEKVEGREFDDNKKICLSFEGRDEILAMNKTNVSIMIEAFGSETDNWVGKKLSLVLIKTKFQGQQVDSIQIKPKK